MNVPEQKTNYVFNTEKSSCTNGAKIDWDKHEWQPIVTNLDSNKTKCILYFEANASAYLASIAINSSDLEYDGTTNNDLRYAGQNPSNYVDLGKDIQQMYIMAILLIIINICLKYLVH